MNQKTLFGIAVAMMVGVFALAAFLHDGGKPNAPARPAAVNQVALERDHAPTVGPREARVHIVEFFDPACETCRSFYPLVKQIMQTAPDKIRLSMRYAPLHEGSDEVVRMIEAAKQQGKFWETLEVVFAAQADWAINHRAHPERVWPHLEKVAGLDLARLKTDMRSPAVETVIAQDVMDANTLNVSATPEFFVNGRPMPSFGLEQLKALVSEELARTK